MDIFYFGAIAVGGASYSSDFVLGIRTNCVLIPDQDWKRNKQVGDQVKKAILNGFKVCMLPSTITGKDINDIVKAGLSLDELKKLIDNHVYTGLEAQLEFALLKKY